MFIKISVLFHPDEPFEIMASTPNGAFMLICILDESKKVVGWNMNEYKPEHFGWMKAEQWNKYKENFFS